MNRSSTSNGTPPLQSASRNVQISQFAAPGRACAKFVWHSPPKVRRITRLLKGYLVKDALDMLKFYRHGASLTIYKVIKSAAHNYMQSNPDSTIDMLQIRRVFADDAPRVKRLWRRARGRADILLKRMCHITVIVDIIDRSAVAPKTIATVRLQPKTSRVNNSQQSVSQSVDVTPKNSGKDKGSRSNNQKKTSDSMGSLVNQDNASTSSRRSQSNEKQDTVSTNNKSVVNSRGSE